MSSQMSLDRYSVGATASSHRASFLSASIDPLLELKASPEVSARRAALTRLVKIVLACALLLCAVAVVRTALASSSDEPAVGESQIDRDRVARSHALTAAKAPEPRGAVHSALRSPKAFVGYATSRR